MTIINTNIPSLTAVNNLSKNTKGLNTSIRNLSTGLKINSAADGPASLVISEKLRSQIASLHQAAENTSRAINILRTAEAALNEVNGLLVSIQDLVIEAANEGALTEDEVLANQAEIDNAVSTINRIANTTLFGNISLLDGNGSDYNTSGLDRANVAETKIFAAGISNQNSQVSVNITVTQNASQAIISNIALGIGASGADLLITGNKGTELLNFASSAANSAIVAAVNGVSGNTGVTATLSGTTIYYQSEFYGSDQFVSVSDIKNLSSNTTYLDQRDEGSDIVGTINGQEATGNGLTLKIDTFNLKAELTLSADFFTDLTTGFTSAQTSFFITGGGFAFNIGHETTDNNKAFLGIQRMTSDNLGDRSVGFIEDIVTGGMYDLLNNPSRAGQIVTEAINDVSALRARMGAMEANTLNSNLNSVEAAISNLTETESRIRDTDFAAETANFTRNQILVQAATSMVAQANAAPQSVLQLLG